MAHIKARFRLDRPGFCLDVDLTLPHRGVTALFGPRAPARRRCCVVLPDWSARPLVLCDQWRGLAGRETLDTYLQAGTRLRIPGGEPISSPDRVG